MFIMSTLHSHNNLDTELMEFTEVYFFVFCFFNITFISIVFPFLTLWKPVCFFAFINI